MTDQDNPFPGLGAAAVSGPPSAALLRARAAALAELQSHTRPVSWRRDAVAAVLLVLASTVIVMAVGAWFSIVEIDRVRERIWPLLLLAAVQGLGVFAAIVPGRPLVRRSAALLAAAAAIAIVAGRGAGLPSATPPLACSTSHLAVDLIPLCLVLFALRRFSATIGRSLLAGVAAAATGAIAGELSCGRGWSHVLIHHIGTAVVIAVGCVLLSRVRRPDTFAP